ncbi:MAG: recombinase family protein [Bacteroidetes bacterium]|nr:recombinase family protein [Bacteroidota bacterium]
MCRSIVSQSLQRNDIAIVHSFKEDFSAKTFDRPAFVFLKFAKANKGKIDLLLFTSWDRFSRNIASI